MNSRSDYVHHTVHRQLDPLCRSTIDAIHSASDASSEDMVLEFQGFSSLAKAEQGEICDTDGYRPATSEETAIIEFLWLPDSVTVDLRNPLPRQVASRLRDLAASMLTNADAIEAVEDCRDLRRVRSLVASISEGGEG